MCNLLLLVRVYWLLFTFIYLGVKVGLLVRACVRACVVVLNIMRLHEKEISILIVIADPGIFIRIIRSYLCTINSVAGIATK